LAALKETDLKKEIYLANENRIKRRKPDKFFIIE
jgi:hypothetical protein